MTKEELKALGLSDDLVDKILTGFKGFIPKSRFDEVNETKKKAEETIKDRDKQLETLKKSTGDTEALKAEIVKLQTANKTEADKYAADIKTVKINAAVETALMAAGAKNVKAVKALLNLDKAALDEDGTVKGLKDQIKTIKSAEDSKFLFAEKQQTGLKGVKPGVGTGQPGKVTKEMFDKMGYKERVDLFNTDKATYDSLSGQIENE